MSEIHMVKRLVSILGNGGEDNWPYCFSYLLNSSTTECVDLVIPIWGDCDIVLMTVTVFFPSGCVVSWMLFVIVVGYVQAEKRTEIPITNSNFIFFIISTSFSNVLSLIRSI
jgi:hypothetical protein